jgi:hypothetical protein
MFLHLGLLAIFTNIYVHNYLKYLIKSYSPFPATPCTPYQPISITIFNLQFSNIHNVLRMFVSSLKMKIKAIKITKGSKLRNLTSRCYCQTQSYCIIIARYSGKGFSSTMKYILKKSGTHCISCATGMAQ